MNRTNNFPAALRRFQLRWQLGLLMAGLLRALLWLGIALVAFGVLDFYAGFSDAGRRWTAVTLALIAGAGAMRALWDTFIFMRRDAAAAADRALGSPRREVLSALEMQGSNGAGTAPLSQWLRQRAVDSAARNLGALTLSRSLPLRGLTRRAKQFGSVLAGFALLAVLAPNASRVIAQRLLQPGADVPPWSPLQFALGPQPAEVLYGGEILIGAEITGAKLTSPVRCLTRDPATRTVEESPAFQENAARFSRKLEKVAGPVEVAFAVGRARSAWMPVAVRMQPKVQDVMLTVEPPAYSGLPTREFAVGTQDLAALPGSRITARVASNRPLSGGTLRIAAPGANDAPQEVAAEREETHRVRFTWTARGAARLALEVRDVVGTASESLQLEQKVAPDERPEVALRSPAGDVLATPDSELPLEASASDDLGLTRVSLVRQLRGYRERSLGQPLPAGRRHEVTGKLNLAPFGVVPGQVIELTLEAGDTNPNLLGVSVSEPARVHIITREQYAEMLRAQTTLEDFAGRYEALRDAMDEARKSIEALEKAAAEGDPPKAEEARKKSFEAHQKAAELFGKIAKDFPVFDSDPALAEASLEAMGKLFENAKQLDGLAAAPDLGGAIAELKRRLGETAKQMTDELNLGERAIAAGKVIEQAGRFRELIENQRQLVKDFHRVIEQIRRGEAKAGQALPDLGQRQSDLAASLRQVEKELDAALGELPEEFAPMKEEGAKFLEALRELEIPPTMDHAAKAAEGADSKSSGDRADESLAKLEALLRKKNGICEMCRGEGEGFPWPEDLAQTMQQLMQALIPRPGGSGSGNPAAGMSGGGGFGGQSDSGFAMKGKMPRLPIFGPSRAQFSRKAAPSLGGGSDGTGKGDGRPEGNADISSNQLATKSQDRSAGEAVPIEAVPEAYREAVKRYFSTEDKTGTTPAPTTPP